MAIAGINKTIRGVNSHPKSAQIQFFAGYVFQFVGQLHDLQEVLFLFFRLQGRISCVGYGKCCAVEGCALLSVIRIAVQGCNTVELAALVIFCQGNAGAVSIIAIVSHPVILDISLQISVVSIGTAVIVNALQSSVFVYRYCTACLETAV